MRPKPPSLRQKMSRSIKSGTTLVLLGLATRLVCLSAACELAQYSLQNCDENYSDTPAECHRYAMPVLLGTDCFGYSINQFVTPDTLVEISISGETLIFGVPGAAAIHGYVISEPHTVVLTFELRLADAVQEDYSVDITITKIDASTYRLQVNDQFDMTNPQWFGDLDTFEPYLFLADDYTYTLPRVTEEFQAISSNIVGHEFYQLRSEQTECTGCSISAASQIRAGGLYEAAFREIPTVADDSPMTIDATNMAQVTVTWLKGNRDKTMADKELRIVHIVLFGDGRPAAMEEWKFTVRTFCKREELAVTIVENTFETATLTESTDFTSTLFFFQSMTYSPIEAGKFESHLYDFDYNSLSYTDSACDFNFQAYQSRFTYYINPQWFYPCDAPPLTVAPSGRIESSGNGLSCSIAAEPAGNERSTYVLHIAYQSDLVLPIADGGQYGYSEFMIGECDLIGLAPRYEYTSDTILTYREPPMTFTFPTEHSFYLPNAPDLCNGNTGQTYSVLPESTAQSYTLTDSSLTIDDVANEDGQTVILLIETSWNIVSLLPSSFPLPASHTLTFQVASSAIAEFLTIEMALIGAGTEQRRLSAYEKNPLPKTIPFNLYRFKYKKNDIGQPGLFEPVPYTGYTPPTPTQEYVSYLEGSSLATVDDDQTFDYENDISFQCDPWSLDNQGQWIYLDIGLYDVVMPELTTTVQGICRYDPTPTCSTSQESIDTLTEFTDKTISLSADLSQTSDSQSLDQFDSEAASVLPTDTGTGCRPITRNLVVNGESRDTSFISIDEASNTITITPLLSQHEAGEYTSATLRYEYEFWPSKGYEIQLNLSIGGCSCTLAFQEGSIDSQKTIQLEPIDFIVHAEPLEIQLADLESFCAHSHTEDQGLDYATLIDLATGTETTLSDQNQLQGFKLQQGKVIIDADDNSLYDKRLNLMVVQRYVEEPELWQRTLIKVNFLKPFCSISQADIDALTGVDQQISLEAMRLVGTDEQSYAVFAEKALTAFQVEQETFCGAIGFALIDDSVGEDRDMGFLVLDEESQKVSVSPMAILEAGLYDQFYLHWFFEEAPYLQFNVRLAITVLECATNKAAFNKLTIMRTYNLCEQAISLPFPTFEAEPDCASGSMVENWSIVPLQEPKGVPLSELISLDLDKGKVRILETSNLALLGRQATFKLMATYEGFPLETTFAIFYSSSGPQFDTESYLLPAGPKPGDLDIWRFPLPPVRAADQQQVIIEFTRDTPFSALFIFSEASQELLFDPDVQEQLVSGEGRLESGTFKLKFKLTSDLLGEAIEEFSFEVPQLEQKKAEVAQSTFEFDSSSLMQEQNEQSDEAEIVEDVPTLSIESISSSGVVKIAFSDPLLVPDDYKTKLKEKRLTLTGTERSNLELSVVPVETQTEAQVDFSWTAIAFTPKQLTLELKFNNTEEISRYEDPNVLQVTVWKPSLFTRASDGKTVASQNVVSKDIAAVVDTFAEDQIAELAALVSNVGKSSVAFVVVLNFFGNFGVNQLLGLVKNLSTITHMMIMQLDYPESSTAFFSAVFGFVTFDLIPTDWLYSELLKFVDVPYSDEADAIGYGSRFVTSNLGSASLVIFALPIIHLFYFAMYKCSSPGSKVHSFAKTKRENFFYGGLIEFFTDVYIVFSFACIINSSSYEFTTPAVTFNNIFAAVAGLSIIIGPLIIVLSLRAAWQAQKAAAAAALLSASKTDDAPDKTVSQLLEGGSVDSEEAQGPSQRSHMSSSLQGSVKSSTLSAPQQIESAKSNPCQRAEEEQAEKEEEEESDPVEAKFGGLIEGLPCEQRLSRSTALTFIALKYYRTFILAATILWFYNYPSLQVICALWVNLVYLMFIAGQPVFKTRSEQRSEVSNEVIVLLTIYSLMCFTGKFVSDPEMRYTIGIALVSLITANFALSMLPTLSPLWVCLRRRYIRCRKGEAQAQEWLDAHNHYPGQMTREQYLEHRLKQIRAEHEDQTPQKEQEQQVLSLSSSSSSSSSSEESSEQSQDQEGKSGLPESGIKLVEGPSIHEKPLNPSLTVDQTLMNDVDELEKEIDSGFEISAPSKIVVDLNDILVSSDDSQQAHIDQKRPIAPDSKIMGNISIFTGRVDQKLVKLNARRAIEGRPTIETYMAAEKAKEEARQKAKVDKIQSAQSLEEWTETVSESLQRKIDKQAKLREEAIAGMRADASPDQYLKMNERVTQVNLQAIRQRLILAEFTQICMTQPTEQREASIVSFAQKHSFHLDPRLLKQN